MLPVACLFDFDGVIVDSFNAHNAAWKNAYFDIFRMQMPEFPHDTLSGKSPKLIAEYFCTEANQKDKTMELFELKAKYIAKGLVSPDLLPGVNEITTFLQIKNIPYGIASNATRKFVGEHIHQLNIDFTTYFGFEDYVHPKPNPEPYLVLAKKLGVNPKQFARTWVFEDSKTGTNAARDAGMIPIGIMTQFSESELRAAGSQLVFPSLKEAWEYLKSL